MYKFFEVYATFSFARYTELCSASPPLCLRVLHINSCGEKNSILIYSITKEFPLEAVFNIGYNSSSKILRHDDELT